MSLKTGGQINVERNANGGPTLSYSIQGIVVMPLTFVARWTELLCGLQVYFSVPYFIEHLLVTSSAFRWAACSHDECDARIDSGFIHLYPDSHWLPLTSF